MKWNLKRLNTVYLLYLKKDTGFVFHSLMMLNNITAVRCGWLLFDHQKARMDKGDIKKKDIILTIVMRMVMLPF